MSACKDSQLILAVVALNNYSRRLRDKYNNENEIIIK